MRVPIIYMVGRSVCPHRPHDYLEDSVEKDEWITRYRAAKASGLVVWNRESAKWEPLMGCLAGIDMCECNSLYSKYADKYLDATHPSTGVA